MEWTKFYYANPTPERFVGEVREMAARGALVKPENRVVTGTFLGRVLAANPARLPVWFAALADITGDAREVLHVAAWMSGTEQGRAYLVAEGAKLAAPSPDLPAVTVSDGTVLDMLWAHYFATGDARAIRRIVTALEFLSDFGAAARFEQTAQTDDDRRHALNDAIFQAASWSLESLMKEHPPLLLICEQIFDAPDLSPNERVGLALVLHEVDPAVWDVRIEAGQAHVTRRSR